MWRCSRSGGPSRPDRPGPLTGTREPAPPSAEVAELAARSAALRQAASSPGAEPGELLEAALADLEGAVDLLKAGQHPPAGQADRPDPGPESAERQLLRAVFQDAPVPLFLVARDGVVQRINRSAGELIGARPGYATGRAFTAFVSLPSRAAVQSQLSAVRPRNRFRTRCTRPGTRRSSPTPKTPASSVPARTASRCWSP